MLLYFRDFRLSATPPYEFMTWRLQSHFSKIIKRETKLASYPDIDSDNFLSSKRLSCKL